MPISADRFEAIAEEPDGPSPGTNAHTILEFLAANPGKAYTQSEIATATDVTRGSVGPTLVRLRDAGRVDHRGTYWRVGDHERSLEAAAGHASASAAAREGEPFDVDSWLAHAEDPREGRE